MCARIDRLTGIAAILVGLAALPSCKDKDGGSTGSGAASAAPTTPTPSVAATPPSATVATASASPAATAAIPNCKKGDQAACSSACDGGDLPSCSSLGDLLLKSDDKDTKSKCEPPLRKACDGKVGRACSALGSRCLPMVILATGRKTYVNDKKEQAALNDTACGLDDGPGCLNLAKDYEDGYGVEQDDAKAKTAADKALKLLPKACDSGDTASCNALAMLYDPATKSKRVPKDPKKAADLYKKACDGGDQMGCDGAKRLGK